LSKDYEFNGRGIKFVSWVRDWDWTFQWDGIIGNWNALDREFNCLVEWLIDDQRIINPDLCFIIDVHHE
jgi:hypothetical protein